MIVFNLDKDCGVVGILVIVILNVFVDWLYDECVKIRVEVFDGNVVDGLLELVVVYKVGVVVMGVYGYSCIG